MSSIVSSGFRASCFSSSTTSKTVCTPTTTVTGSESCARLRRAFAGGCRCEVWIAFSPACRWSAGCRGISSCGGKRMPELNPVGRSSRPSAPPRHWNGWPLPSGRRAGGGSDDAGQLRSRHESHHSGLTSNRVCPQMFTFPETASLGTIQTLCIQQSAGHSALRMALQMLSKDVEEWHIILGRHSIKSREENK